MLIWQFIKQSTNFCTFARNTNHYSTVITSHNMNNQSFERKKNPDENSTKMGIFFPCTILKSTCYHELKNITQLTGAVT